MQKEINDKRIELGRVYSILKATLLESKEITLDLETEVVKNVINPKLVAQRRPA